MNQPSSESGPFWAGPRGILLSAMLAIVALYFWFEHRVHVLAVLPFLLPLFICLGMHFFMHGHGGGNRRGEDERDH